MDNTLRFAERAASLKIAAEAVILEAKRTEATHRKC
jgi:hypothetical protein